MERTIDDQHLQALLDQNLSERAIAKQTGIPRTTLKRRIAKLHGTQEVRTGVPEEPAPAMPGAAMLQELIDAQDDLVEMAAWWRERKELVQRTQAPADPERETERKTYHVQKRFIKAIERASDLERVSQAEIVNRAFAHYFQAEV